MTDLDKRFNIKIPKQIDFTAPILVIQSQQDLRLIVAHHLQKLNFSKVVQCGSTIEALEIIPKHPNLQAIICDFSMPNMGSADFLAELKNNNNLCWAPVVITMEVPSQEKLMLMIESGAEEIMAKPFTLGDVMPKVKSAFAKFHNPKNPEKIYEMAKQYLRSKEPEAAREIYMALAESSPTAARPWVGLASASHMEGKLDDAFKALGEAKRRNEKFVHVYAYEGNWQAEKKDWDQALKAFKHAISLSPLNGFRYKAAAEILMQEKKYEEVKALLQEAINREINFAELHNFMSQACFSLQDFKGAIKAVRQALVSEPENVTFLNQLGISYKEVGMAEEALKTYNSVIKLDPENIPALFNKGILCKDAGQLEDAIKLFERILKKKPNFQPAQHKLQEILNLKKPKAG